MNVKWIAIQLEGCVENAGSKWLTWFNVQSAKINKVSFIYPSGKL